MKLRTLSSAPISKDTHVLVRIDSDVEVVGGLISGESAYRLDCAIPTLKYLLKKKAVVTIIGHRGRPQGKKVAALSLEPVQKYFERKLKTKLRFLPNVRFDAREEKNDATYARELALDNEIFVNESFATAHRKHASTHAITKILPSFAGLQFEKEVVELAKLFEARSPLAVIIGGAKIETKVPVINQFVKHAQHIFVVGAGANAFFAARGMRIGDSFVSKESISAAKKIVKHQNIFIPIDCMVGKAQGNSSSFKAVAFPEELTKNFEICKTGSAILDVGPATILMISEMLADMKTIIWNGPAGKLERKPFDLGTVRIARMLSKLGRGGTHVVAGGGETVTAIMQNKMSRGYAHISTGGGAMLEFLGGKPMPVIVALSEK